MTTAPPPPRKLRKDDILAREFAALPADQKQGGRAKQISHEILRCYENLCREEAARFERKELVPCKSDLDDVYQAAQEGVLNALRKFDPNRVSTKVHAQIGPSRRSPLRKGIDQPFFEPGVRKPVSFVTCVRFWVRHYTQLIPVKYNVVNTKRQSGMPMALKRLSDRVMAQYGREATAEELGVTDKDLEDWRSTPSCISLDSENKTGRNWRNAGKAYRIIDSLASQEPDPYFCTERDAMGNHALALLEILAPEEREVVLALDINDEKPRAVAKDMGLHLYELDAIHKRALAKLKDALADDE